MSDFLDTRHPATHGRTNTHMHASLYFFWFVQERLLFKCMHVHLCLQSCFKNNVVDSRNETKRRQARRRKKLGKYTQLEISNRCLYVCNSETQTWVFLRSNFSVIQSDLIRKRCLCVNVWRSVWSGSVLACVCECFFVCVHACAYAVWYPPGCVCLCTFINVRMSWCVHLFVSRTLPMCGHIKSAHTPQSLHCVTVIFHFTDTWACLISVTNSTWSNHELRHTSHKTDIHVSVHILTPMPVHARTLTSRHEWQVHPRLTHICTHVCTRNHRHSSCEGRSCWALRIDG